MKTADPVVAWGSSLCPARLQGALLPHTNPPADACGDSSQQAAVLVALVEYGNEAGVLLTRRAAGLRQHAGQIAFPGGKIDATDAGPEAAALREAQEEIGLIAADVRVLGRLPYVFTGSGFRVAPIVGLVRGDPTLSPAPDEVAEIFTLSWSVLRDASAPYQRTVALNGGVRSVWVWPHADYDIWGATASILVELAAVMVRA